MTEHEHIDGHDLAGGAPGSAGFDDDRLLAYALGLEDDAELRSALAGNDALRDRLAAMQADLEQVEGGIRSAVPPAPPAYDDPADARWQALRPYFEHRETAPRRGFFGRRALAYAAALAIVAAVSVAVVNTQFRGGPTTTARSEYSAPQDQAKTTGQQAGNSSNLSAYPTPASATNGSAGDFVARLAAEAQSWQRVVVARARAVADGAQRFAIVRVLKGAVQARAVSLFVVGTPPLAAGTLCVLYLDPVAQYGSGSTPPTPTGSPELRSFYSLTGAPALVEPLPAGVDADALTLP